MFQLNKYISRAGTGAGQGQEQEHWVVRMSDGVDTCLGATPSSEHKQNYLTEIFVWDSVIVWHCDLDLDQGWGTSVNNALKVVCVNKTKNSHLLLLSHFHPQLKYRHCDIIHDISPDSSGLLSDKMNSEGPRTGQCWWYGVGVLAPAAHLSHHLTGFHVSAAGRCWCRCTYFWFNEHYKWECQNKNLTIALALSYRELLYKRGRPVSKICRLVQESHRVIHWSTVYWKFGDNHGKSGHLFSWM